MAVKILSCMFGDFIFYQRYVLIIMMQLAMLNAYHFRVVLHIALMEIIQPANDTKELADACPELTYTKVPVKGKTYSWPPHTEALILYSFYIGYVLGHIPAGWLSDKLGGRHVLGLSMMLCVFFNVFLPLSITHIGAWGAVVLRALIGFAQGPIYPAISAFIQNWIPRSERGFLGSAAYTGANLGTLTGGALTGVLIQATQSWAVPFYVWSLCAVVWYVFYLFVVFSKPETHPFITDKEKKFLATQIDSDTKKKFKVPWVKLILSPPVWALFFGQWGHDYLFVTMFTTLPRYLREILKMDVGSNSMFSTFPFFMLWATSLIFGLLADFILKKEWLSLVVTRKLYTVVGAMMPACCILVTVFVGCNRTVAITLYTIGVAFIGPFFAGMKVNVNDITRYYGGTVMSFINGSGATSGIVGPWVVGAIVKESSFYQWMVVYLIMVGVEIVCCAFYIIFAQAERQPWDYPEDQSPRFSE